LRHVGKPKPADYVLYYKPNVPTAFIEAKDNKHAIGDGLQQALEYADALRVLFIFSSDGAPSSSFTIKIVVPARKHDDGLPRALVMAVLRGAIAELGHEQVLPERNAQNGRLPSWGLGKRRTADRRQVT
jgi:hypothetical protein